MGIASPQTTEEKQRANDLDLGYETGWKEGVEAFAALLRSSWCDNGYPADAHAFAIHDKLLANIIERRLKEDH